MKTISKRSNNKQLCRDELQQVVADAAATLGTEGKSVVIIIPDGTRTMPMPFDV